MGNQIENLFEVMANSYLLYSLTQTFWSIVYNIKSKQNNNNNDKKTSAKRGKKEEKRNKKMKILKSNHKTLLSCCWRQTGVILNLIILWCVFISSVSTILRSNMMSQSFCGVTNLQQLFVYKNERMLLYNWL